MFVLKYGELVLRKREMLRALRARDFVNPGVKKTREMLYQHAPQQEDVDKQRRELVEVGSADRQAGQRRRRERPITNELLLLLC